MEKFLIEQDRFEKERKEHSLKFRQGRTTHSVTVKDEDVLELIEILVKHQKNIEYLEKLAISDAEIRNGKFSDFDME